jgi:hypothetical protein
VKKVEFELWPLCLAHNLQKLAIIRSSVFYRLPELFLGSLEFSVGKSGAGGRVGLEGTAQLCQLFLEGRAGVGLWELVTDRDDPTHRDLFRHFLGFSQR